MKTTGQPFNVAEAAEEAAEMNEALHRTPGHTKLVEEMEEAAGSVRRRDGMTTIRRNCWCGKHSVMGAECDHISTASKRREAKRVAEEKRRESAYRGVAKEREEVTVEEEAGELNYPKAELTRVPISPREQARMDALREENASMQPYTDQPEEDDAAAEEDGPDS